MITGTVRRLSALWGLAALLGAIALPYRARAQGAPAPAPANGPAAAAPVAFDPHEWQLRRAVTAQVTGDLDAVIDDLEAIDFEHEPVFPEADRAAFLLAHAYLGRGDHARFERLAHAVARWRRTSGYTEWIARMRVTLEAGPDSAVALARLGAARGTAGSGAAAELLAQAGADTTTALGRDLAGAAHIAEATALLAHGGDPRATLGTVPADSRYATLARHMSGLVALERGEGAAGEETLRALVHDDSLYVGRREVLLALAGHALETGRWEEAQADYAAVDRDWAAERDTLARLRTGEPPAALWSAWQSMGAGDAVVYDGAPLWSGGDSLAMFSADLTTRPELAIPSPRVPEPAARFPWAVAPPTADEWHALGTASEGLTAVEAALARERWAAGQERAWLAQVRRHLGSGRARADSERVSLVVRTAHLDSLRGSLDSLDARLRAVRDDAIARLRARAESLRVASEDDARWVAALRFYHLDGPRTGPAVPPGRVGPDSLLASEDALTRSLGALASRLAAETPGLVARSYEQAWRPGLVERAGRLDEEARRALAQARRLGGTLDSAYAAATSSDSLRYLETHIAGDQQLRERLLGEQAALRTRIGRAAVGRALAALGDEREGIDYGLATAAYGLSVRLSHADSSGAAPAGAPVAAAPADAGDPVLDSPAATAWRGQAIERMRGFLSQHPRSAARGEMRFRLADLLLIDARQRYREQMARYVREQSEHGVAHHALPVLEQAPALALYRAILAEDPDFPHRDAVLFDAGMLLADDGDAGAERFFADLVAQHPDSPYAQEAYLRMGDMRFNERRFREGIELYTHAAAGSDPSLQAIALYKMGWAHFNEERFAEAADAFRQVLDLYGSERRAQVQVDVEHEAENDLILALARAGGAEACAAFFDRVGQRPYELRVLHALGQHFRRYSLYAEAAGVEQLTLRRYPLHPDALLSAERLIETERRAERGVQQRAAQLELAPRFAPGGAWAEAQTSDSVRTAGEDFARASWTAVALYHHEQARAKGAPEDWREARRLYETVIERWPHDPRRAAFELGAGEASARLGEYPQALAHYAAAAHAGPDSVEAEALWQRVAVSDAWYESTRAAARTGREGLGRDSLARLVLDAGDALVARFPAGRHAPDVTWREGHLALAHGWLPRAADDFGRLASRYPGDPRAPQAALLRGDALFRDRRFEDAGNAYEEALAVAQRAGVDSLARRARAALPVCAYRRAEAAVAQDSTAYARHAELFEIVAARWPTYEHAPLAQYRAGLAYLQAGKREAGVAAMQHVIHDFPRSEFVRDAHLQVARAWEAGGERERAAQAYTDFATRFPQDESAGAASLKAADLFEAAGLRARADTLRIAYVRKHPDDVETAMEVFEGLARADLARVDEAHPISALLAPAKPVRGRPAAPVSHLAEYLKRAQANPKLASAPLIAQVRFLEAEEVQRAYAAATLRQPLDRSIPIKQKRLDDLLARYRRCADVGVAEWADAAAFRIGEALVAFGTALEASERPADLRGEDLKGYEDVLHEQAQAFYDKGEGVWSELLKRAGGASATNTWLDRARTALWGRLGNRFFFRPEVEFPLVSATPPEHARRDHERGDSASNPPARAESLHAQREERPR